MTMGLAIVAVGGFAAWVVWAAFVHALARISPREDDDGRPDLWAGLAMLFIVLYARLVQRLRIEGREHAPKGRRVGPLVVVANHTAGVDPLLIQAALPFEVRWMMARDMQHQALAWLWEFTGVIGVTRLDAAEGGEVVSGGRRGSDSTAAREAIRHLQAGGVIGVFPEGRIIGRGRVGEFLPGVGLLVSRTGARVLQAVIDGTAETGSAWGSLVLPGRARVRFLPLLEYRDAKAAEIAADLRARLIAETGWRPMEQND
ncbi:MAG: 1-acyl-sn-glycerol-3-phosphate acyltransferase [Phycisphaeraceae bacterium]|nr:1-acyl-sn-glycerol-3-phosphate acyltransferase [Phycisphaeraceae bacterium]